MKNVKQGAFATLAAMAGGAAGTFVMTKVVPANTNKWIKNLAPAGGCLIITLMVKKQTPPIQGFAFGMAGVSGSEILKAEMPELVSGVGAAEETLLLDAFSEVNGTEDAEFQLLDSEPMNAAASFDGSVAAPADFNSAVAGTYTNAY